MPGNRRWPLNTGPMRRMGLKAPFKSSPSQTVATAQSSAESLQPAQSPTDRQLSPILKVFVIETASRLPISEMDSGYFGEGLRP